MKNTPISSSSLRNQSLRRFLCLLPVIILLVLTSIFAFQRSALMQDTSDLLRPTQTYAGWTTTGSLGSGRGGHTATLLPNGKILVAGGFNNNTVLNTAELYDPATRLWSPTGNLDGGRAFHTATLLPDGRVLIVGGETTLGGPGINWTEVYNPATGQFSSTNNRLATGRYLHSATLLSNGKVLVSGGSGASGYLKSSEIYDPTTFLWTSANDMVTARGGHTATLLINGKVLAAGGFNARYLGSAELFDPATGNWIATGNFSPARNGHTATRLINGRVLVSGGYNNGDLKSSLIYDPVLGSWAPTNDLQTARSFHTATQLIAQTGQVLVAGGMNGAAQLSSSELYTTSNGTWSTTSNLNQARSSHPSVLFSDGRVLVVGGNNGLTSAEIYDPLTFAFDTYEGDVVDSNGGAGGDGQILANDVGVIRQFALGLLTPVTVTNQFQRADINSTCGDGAINAADVTVVRQILLGSIIPTFACGPTVPTIPAPEEAKSAVISDGLDKPSYFAAATASTLRVALS